MRISLCNEVLQPLPFAQQCKAAADMGYDALEVAPFTLADDPTAITDAQAREFARIASDHGLAISGLHWLLVQPAGLTITEGDDALRSRTAAWMERLVDMCAAMGGTYLVHGSPKQRRVPDGGDPQLAWERARECFARAGRRAQACGVTYCIEPLARREANLLNTVEEAARMVDEIGIPALRTMIDCSAAGQTEDVPVHELMAKWMPTGHIAHVQVNDPNRRGPGQGGLRFEPILRTLEAMHAQGHYNDLIAVEPFDYVPDGIGCAARSVGYLRGVLEGLHPNG
jgi:sugar phosphate isomerase/epimerase